MLGAVQSAVRCACSIPNTHQGRLPTSRKLVLRHYPGFLCVSLVLRMFVRQYAHAQEAEDGWVYSATIWNQGSFFSR